MTTTYSGSYWNGLLAEAKFASGAGAAAYDETEPANSAALSAQNFPFNEDIDVSAKEYFQEALEAAGQGKSQKTTFTNATDIMPGSKHQYVQNTDWITRAIAGTAGAVPVDASTWAEVFYDGIRYKASYGCYITNYVLSLDKRSWPKEDIEYLPYDTKAVVTPGNFSTVVGWDKSTSPKIYKDFAISIDGVALNEFETLTLTIAKGYTEPQAGVELHKYPRLITDDWKIDISSHEYMAFLDDQETSAADLIPAVLSGWGSALTTTFLKLTPGSSNIKTMPSKGQKIYSGSLEIGGNSTAVLS